MQLPDALKPLSPNVLDGLRAVARQLPAEQIAARKAGLLLTGAELRARTKVPVRDNAAPIYRERTKAKNAAASRAASEALPRLSKARPVTPADLAAGKAALAQNAGPLSRFEAALARRGCDFGRRWEDGTEVALPEYATIRDAARLIALQAIVLSEEGKPIDALKAISRGVALARHAFWERTLISQLVGIAVLAILDAAFHALLRRHGRRPDVLTAAEKAARALDLLPNFPAAIGAEMAIFHETMQRNRAGKLDPGTPPSGLTGADTLAFYDATEVQMLRWLRAMAERPWKTDDDLRRLRQWLDAQGRDLERRAPTEPSLGMAAVLLPVWPGYIDKILHSRGLSRLRVATIALIRNPGARLPPDPFAGGPLRLRKTAGGFVVWSVGANGKDDGGVKVVGENKLADVVVAWP